MDSRKVGILGGGQLGRMLAASASLLNVEVLILDKGDDAPAKQILAIPSSSSSSSSSDSDSSSGSSGGHVDGSFTDPAKIRELAAKVDVLTVEIEHVDVDVLEEIEKWSSTEEEEGKRKKVVVHPSPATIRIIQDKFVQKAHLSRHGIAVGDYAEVEAADEEGIKAIVEKFGLPVMLKSRTLAYDGRGNYLLKNLDSIPSALSALGNKPLYAERFIPFVKEVAVIVVRNASGDEVLSYPAVETVHKENICHLVFAPLRAANAEVLRRAQRLAEDAVRTFEGAGVFGVEMFLLADDTLLINEIAPRPHNSGHYTIEACYTSQYENHLRAILGLPLGSPSMKVASAAMVNLIGPTTTTSSSDPMADLTSLANLALRVPGASVHLYGKRGCRPGRKMGHITLVNNHDAVLRANLRHILASMPGADLSHTPDLTPGGGNANSQFPLVGIIMGSDSDLPILTPAARILDKFGVAYELTIVSAHRTPDRMVSYARSAAARGVRVIIAGAGGAAHLPGMCAALTSVPVIGVPVKGSSLDGVDSLHSIVQMPRGIPVATVAINGGMNAGLLAVRILSASVPHLASEMDTFMKKQEEEVLGKVEKLEQVGWENYKV